MGYRAVSSGTNCVGEEKPSRERLQRLAPSWHCRVWGRQVLGGKPEKEFQVEVFLLQNPEIKTELRLGWGSGRKSYVNIRVQKGDGYRGGRTW